MKRREFLSSAGATAVIPVLPLPAMATPTAVAPANAAQVGWAALFARVNNRATPALIDKWMGVGPQQAQALMNELVSRNIIHAPVAGSAVSVQPMYPNKGIPGTLNSASEVIQKARKMFDAVIGDDMAVDEHDEMPRGDHDDQTD